MSAECRQTAVYDDLYKIPDNMIGQIIGGELFAMPRPSPRHVRSASVLSSRITADTIRLGDAGEHRKDTGKIPDSPEKAAGRAGTMTRKGIGPVVRLCDKLYEKGVSLTEKEFQDRKNFLYGILLFNRYNGILFFG